MSDTLTTDTTTSTGDRRRLVDPARPAVTAHGASFVTATLGTARRTVLQFFRTPQLLFMGTVQGALFLFMFRYVFGGAIDTARRTSATSTCSSPASS